MQQESKQTRRPEDTAQMAHRALKLHAIVRAHATVAGTAEWRARIARDSELSRLDVATIASIERALAAAGDDGRRAAILELARAQLASQLSRRLMRAVHDSIARAAKHAGFITDVATLIGVGAFGALSETVKLAL